MYAERASTIPMSLVLAGFLIAGLLAGGVGGYAIATSTVSVPASVTSAQQAQAGYDERVTTFLATEHQGSAENPVAAQAPSNTTFLASEHQGSAENPEAVRPQGPSNTTFLVNEHQGSAENPTEAGTNLVP